MEKRCAGCKRPELKKIIGILVEYAEERSIDLKTFSLKDVEAFLLWYYQKERNRGVCYRIVEVLIHFYGYLMLTGPVYENPFLLIKYKGLDYLFTRKIFTQ